MNLILERIKARTNLMAGASKNQHDWGICFNIEEHHTNTEVARWVKCMAWLYSCNKNEEQARIIEILLKEEQIPEITHNEPSVSNFLESIGFCEIWPNGISSLNPVTIGAYAKGCELVLSPEEFDEVLQLSSVFISHYLAYNNTDISLEDATNTKTNRNLNL